METFGDWRTRLLPVGAVNPLGSARSATDTAHPVRFPSEVVHEVKRRAEADDRSVASWIRAVEYELNRTA